MNNVTGRGVNKQMQQGLFVLTQRNGKQMLENRTISLKGLSCLAQGSGFPQGCAGGGQPAPQLRQRRISLIRLPRSKLATLMQGGKLRLRRRSFRLQGTVAVNGDSKCKLFVYKQVQG